MVTHDELKKIAALAKLSLDGEDMDALARDMDSILDFAVEISSAPVNRRGETALENAPHFREDIVSPSLTNEEILKNAGEKRDGFFVAREMGGTAR